MDDGAIRISIEICAPSARSFARILGSSGRNDSAGVIILDRLGNFSEFDQRVAQVRINLRIARREANGFAIMLRSFGKAMLNEQGGGKIVVRVGGIRIQFQGRFKIHRRLGKLFLGRQGEAEIVQQIRAAGIQLQRAVIIIYGVAGVAEFHQGIAQIVKCVRVVGLDLQ